MFKNIEKTIFKSEIPQIQALGVREPQTGPSTHTATRSLKTLTATVFMNNQAFGKGVHQNPSGFSSFTMSAPGSQSVQLSLYHGRRDLSLPFTSLQSSHP